MPLVKLARVVYDCCAARQTPAPDGGSSGGKGDGATPGVYVVYERFDAMDKNGELVTDDVPTFRAGHKEIAIQLVG